MMRQGQYISGYSYKNNEDINKRIKILKEQMHPNDLKIIDNYLNGSLYDDYNDYQIDDHLAARYKQRRINTFVNTTGKQMNLIDKKGVDNYIDSLPN